MIYYVVMADNRFPIKMKWQEGGYRVVVDENLDEHSSNPVANWVLKEAIAQGGGGGGSWGTITGTITDQTDLIQYINAHGAGTWGAITGTLTDQTDLVQYITNALSNYYTKSQVYTKAETDALIPTVNDATLTVQKNGTTVDTFTANASANKTINITVPTTAADVSALPDSTKYGASITVSLDSTTYVLTTTLKDQDGNTLGTAQTVDLPIESVVVSGSYDSATKEVVLVLESGSEIRFSVADLVSGLQPEITSSNKLSADLVDDTSTTHKFTTASDISKLDGIEANANNYTLPAATTSTLGGVKVGEHLEIDANGVLETDVHVALYDEPDDPQPIPPVTTDRIAYGAVTEEKLNSDSKYIAGQSLSITHGEKIPAEYQRVAFIQSTTNAYFELSGFSLTGADIVTADVTVNSSDTGWATIWCSRVAGTTDANVVFANTSDGTTVRSDYNTSQTTCSWSYLGERHTFRLSKGNFALDGWQQIKRAEATFTTPAYTTLMCSNLNGETPYNYCRGRIYLFRVERNDEVVLNLVPCYRVSDSRVGLYDTVSGTFYTYTGSGDFTAGTEIDSESSIIYVTQVGNAQYKNASISSDKMSTACRAEMKGFLVVGLGSNQYCVLTIPKTSYYRRTFLVVETENNNQSRRIWALGFGTNVDGNLVSGFATTDSIVGTAPSLTVNTSANTIKWKSLGNWATAVVEVFDCYSASLTTSAS